MTHVLLAHGSDGGLIAARAVNVSDDEVLNQESERFYAEIDQDIGHTVSFLTDADIIQALQAGEFYDSGA